MAAPRPQPALARRLARSCLRLARLLSRVALILILLVLPIPIAPLMARPILHPRRSHPAQVKREE